MATVQEMASVALVTFDLKLRSDLLGDDALVMQEVKRSALAMARVQTDGVVQGMSDVAFKLKSAARSFDAARLGQICVDIEEAAISMPHVARLAPLMAEFEVELLSIHSYLDKRQSGYFSTRPNTHGTAIWMPTWILQAWHSPLPDQHSGRVSHPPGLTPCPAALTRQFDPKI